MEKHIEVIGIDHGWSNMKTATQIFTTGVKEITTEPAFYDDVVELDGKYYKVGGKRLEVRDTKVENDNFYLLTLAAVAKELNRRGMRNADVLLSVGLPLTRFGAEKQDFIDYLSKKKEVAFRFEKERYVARIARVSVFPQCYAAVAEQLKTLPGRVVVVDIGNWTIDIMPIENGKPNEAECITSQQGLIRCMRIINEECNRQIGQELEENVIQQVMATGEAALPDKYMNIVKDCLRDFAQKVYNTLKEHGYNLDVIPIVFVGGGAAVMRLFGSQASGNFQYIEDIKANAKGYEQLGRIFLAKHRKAAAENTRRILPPVVQSMNEVMRDMFVADGMPKELADLMIGEQEPEMTMRVISNERKIDGAASMLYEDKLHSLAERVGTDLYILPSSVHEVIAVSVEMGEPEELARMVSEVNMDQVDLSERLSNQVYHYDKDLRKITLATDTPNKRIDGKDTEWGRTDGKKQSR